MWGRGFPQGSGVGAWLPSRLRCGGVALTSNLSSRTSPSLCCSSTQLGPKAFRWAGSNPRRCPAHLRGRHLSLQLSRQLSVRSLPSPKALGRGRRPSASPPQGPDPLPLPDHDLEHHFQGTAGAEDGRDGAGNVDEEKPTPTNS